MKAVKPGENQKIPALQRAAAGATLEGTEELSSKFLWCTPYGLADQCGSDYPPASEMPTLGTLK